MWNKAPCIAILTCPNKNHSNKHPRASSNEHQYAKTKHITKSSKKKNNILFKLASELSQSPDTIKVRKAYGKDNTSTIKAVSAFGIPSNCSGHRMNTEATDDASLNSSRNRNKSRHNDIHGMHYGIVYVLYRWCQDTR